MLHQFLKAFFIYKPFHLPLFLLTGQHRSKGHSDFSSNQRPWPPPPLSYSSHPPPPLPPPPPPHHHGPASAPPSLPAPTPLPLRPIPSSLRRPPLRPLPRSLAENSARAAAAKISAALPALKRIRAGFPGNRRMASTLDVCAEVYADAVDSLSTAVDALRAAGDMSDVMIHLSASLTDVGTCDDAFDEDPSLPNPLAKISRNLNRLVTNSLALASAVKRNPPFSGDAAAAGASFGLALHGHAVKFGVSSDRSVFTKLLVMYSECGCPGGRDRVFAEFCGSDLFSWNFMINDLARGGDVDAAGRLFDEMPKRNVVSWTVMISENMKTGRIGDAIWYFDRCPCHTVFSCTAMINGFVQNCMNTDALLTFRKMLCSGLMPNEITFTCLVRACIGIGELDLADNVVGMVIKTAFIRKLSVCNSLITLYVRLGDVGVARKLFDEMPERDVVSWTALLDVYFATGFLKEAHRIFDEMPERNEVTWGMMIARCNQHGEASEALRLFSIMLRDGYKPNLSCLASVISASASQGNLLIGASFHSHVTKVGFEDDVFVASSLIEMYSKCGDSDHARQIFDFLSVKNTVCWNAMIGGYCHDGKMEKAKDLLKKNTRERCCLVELNDIWVCSESKPQRCVGDI
ncbi:hypothetical protein HPP92_009710 [Vanilla planifolia]|uniref:Pectinesterase inhibitor domain-containing protein n=1 Tax=Vanilla planifolia TaxID=51239 RepID=A0A835R4Q7_VANPL|nr:hypothetical protein HPP92_009710 [Vanilla planifolia]